MNCISIEIKAYSTKVHQMHISNNSHIKPHIDKFDIESSFIS